MKNLVSARQLTMIVLLATLMGSVGLSSAQTATSSTTLRYVGTWSGTWTSDNNQVPPFAFYMQLGLDGNVSTTESDEFAISKGVWAVLSKDSANLTLYQYSFSALETPYQGIFKVRANVSVSPNGEQISGRYYLEFFDPNNVLQFTDTGKIEGHRVHVEPML
jgi:hypothetical protein